MFRLNLGSGALAFEVEGEADRVRSISPEDLVERKWPPEMVENIRQYQARLKHSHADTKSQVVATDDLGISDFEADEDG